MSLLHLFKCLNPDCGLTSTLSMKVDAQSGALSSSCIHCDAPHDVVRSQSGASDVVYSVTGLSRPRPMERDGP